MSLLEKKSYPSTALLCDSVSSSVDGTPIVSCHRVDVLLSNSVLGDKLLAAVPPGLVAELITSSISPYASYSRSSLSPTACPSLVPLTAVNTNLHCCTEAPGSSVVVTGWVASQAKSPAKLPSV